jgi:putative transposase
VRRSYKFVLRPTKRQEATLGECLEDTRQLYNAALEERREAWRMGGHQTSFASQDAQLKEIRADDPERYGRWAFACERAAVRRLDRAFQGFFRRVKAGERPGYPASRDAAGGTPSSGRFTATDASGTRSRTRP